jgi:hypothetical protein
MEKISKILKVIIFLMLFFLVYQLIAGYFANSAVQRESVMIEGLNIIVDSHVQINKKDGDLYIKSDEIEIQERQLLFRKNIINSTFASGVGDLIVYDQDTGDIFVDNRPKIVFAKQK